VCRSKTEDLLNNTMMKKSSSFSVDLLNSPLPHAGGSSNSSHNAATAGDGGDRCEDDLYFEMEFPVHSSSRLSVESYGSQSTLDSRESPSRDSHPEYRSVAAAGAGGGNTNGPPRLPRERPNSLVIPIRRGKGGDFFGSLPRSSSGKVQRRVPKISLPNYSVPVTPADSWENDGNYLGNANLSGTFQLLYLLES
jgi:hypothetical protein